ncbi:hypothetical protein GLOIN_2v1841252 [Rhizophagus irregularis DAOM 181602=DAOM 197198]|nr:hypothetical protein GLOIN_2v1841252 [Rhizophagus irregularis DAOM 181602=DAOM 197198]
MTQVTKPASINLTLSEKSDDGNSSLVKDENDNSDKDDNEDIPDKIAKHNWSLPLGKPVEGIFLMNVSKYLKRYKQKKRLISVEKAILRYGVLRLIDLSAYMKA